VKDGHKRKATIALTLTEKTLIKHQQADFIEKMATAVPNEHHWRFLRRRRQGQAVMS